MVCRSVRLNRWNVGVVLCFITVFSLPTNIQGSSSSNGTRAVDSLKFVAVVASHGNIAPSIDYSSNPYPTNDTTYWPFGKGEVATEGRHQLYSLGQLIRTYYNGFVDMEFSESDFAAKSPEVDRTTISAQLFTAGLYPPVDYEIWNEDLLWQPIVSDVDSSDKTLDVTTCERFLEEANTSVSNFDALYSSEILKLSKYLTKSTETQISGIHDIALVWEMLYSQAFEGLTEISWVPESYHSQLKNLTGQYYINYYAGSTESVRLVIGILLEEIITAMQNLESQEMSADKSQEWFESQVDDGPGPSPTGGPGPDPNPTGGPGPGPNPTGNPGPSPFSSNQKMIFYSGYNASLITLQAALGIPSSQIVSPIPPGSAMIFELHNNSTSQEYYIQVLWIESGLRTLKPELITIPDCGTSCDLTTFVSLTEKFSNITDFNTECQSTSAAPTGVRL